MTGRRGEELLQLLGGPGIGLDLRDRSEAWRVGHERDVAVDESLCRGVGESASDDEVDLEHGLGSERFATVGGAQHGVVERLELLGAEPADRDAPERREDVAVDLAPVAVKGGRGEVHTLAGQPSAREIGAERERPSGVVASVALLRQSRCEAFGVCSIGAGRVPSPALAAGHRIEPLVDHCVPAGPLLRHVSVHVGSPSTGERCAR